jgi:hypothetical protein
MAKGRTIGPGSRDGYNLNADDRRYRDEVSDEAHNLAVAVSRFLFNKRRLVTGTNGLRQVAYAIQKAIDEATTREAT